MKEATSWNDEQMNQISLFPGSVQSKLLSIVLHFQIAYSEISDLECALEEAVKRWEGI
jgi:hypothetical protein